jgi:hypothetical protein
MHGTVRSQEFHFSFEFVIYCTPSDQLATFCTLSGNQPICHKCENNGPTIDRR